jgi:hypothetical protein
MAATKIGKNVCPERLRGTFDGLSQRTYASASRAKRETASKPTASSQTNSFKENYQAT